MCDGTDDPNQTGTTPNRTRWDNPSRTGTTQPSGTTQPNWDSPAKWDSPGRAGTTQPAGPSQSELGHSKFRLSQSGPGRPSPLGRPTQTWSGPIFSRLLSCVCRVVPVRSLWDLPWNVIPRSGHACRGPRVTPQPTKTHPTDESHGRPPRYTLGTRSGETKDNFYSPSRSGSLRRP